MEIRGLGIINVKDLFGVAAVRMSKGAARFTRPLLSAFAALHRNTRTGSRRNIADHYHLGSDKAPGETGSNNEGMDAPSLQEILGIEIPARRLPNCDPNSF